MSENPYRYTAALAGQIETAWQDRWEAEGTFHAPNPSGVWGEPDRVAGREKLFVLDMFPYPSGAGLHVGHPLGYIATDTYARFQRMRGRNVLHALGYDAFGLPAEQYAVQTGQHPRVTTEQNVANMRRQLRRLGLAHDDRRSVATTDVEFYRWTQWIFLQVFNSWYDTDADGGRGKARPIAELIGQFVRGERAVPDGRAWADLSRAEQAAVIDGYRLAYLSEAPVNWCPGLGTVLANEEVTAEGRSDIGNFPVYKRKMKQWMMRITAYADRLIEDLDRLDWPDKVKAMQRNWIGRSTGAEVTFGVAGQDAVIDVFTTRPDTLFGATFMVVAPEHPLVDAITPSGDWPAGTLDAWTGGAATPQAAVASYREQAGRKTELERQTDAKAKTGVFTGGYAINPVNGKQIPVFIADYVLMGYGTGAIMAVPAQDQRDWDFAIAYDLPIIPTVQPTEGHDPTTAFTGDGPAINSANDELSLNGLGVAEAKAAMIAWLEAKGYGHGTISYKLRDWLFSRQRYWGEPFPIVYDEGGFPIALPESMLPVQLPDVDDYSPQALDPDDVTSEPKPPLARAADWATVTLDLGDGPKTYRRELNVMPQWAGSCWYEMRYLDPANTERFVDREVERYWMGPRDGHDLGGADLADVDPEGDVGGVDLYVGGVEHAVLHLLYARFWHKVLFDLGEVSSAEPFRRLYNQGYIQAYAFRDARGQTVPADEVVDVAGDDGEIHYVWQGEPVTREYGKMGKSLKNVVTPDDMYADYGADTFRIYEMSMGPLDQSKPWETRAVVGSQRFLQRLWRNVVDETTGAVRVTKGPMDAATERSLHKTIDAVTKDYTTLSFNTAIARLTEYNNVLTQLSDVPRAAIEPLLLMVAPLVPHIAEELWSRLGHAESLAFEAFPVADPALFADETVTCVVQVKGKVRARLEVPTDITEDAMRELALAEPRVIEETRNGVRMVIVRAPKLVNVVPA